MQYFNWKSGVSCLRLSQCRRFAYLIRSRLGRQMSGTSLKFDKVIGQYRSRIRHIMGQIVPDCENNINLMGTVPDIIHIIQSSARAILRSIDSIAAHFFLILSRTVCPSNRSIIYIYCDIEICIRQLNPVNRRSSPPNGPFCQRRAQWSWHRAGNG